MATQIHGREKQRVKNVSKHVRIHRKLSKHSESTSLLLGASAWLVPGSDSVWPLDRAAEEPGRAAVTETDVKSVTNSDSPDSGWKQAKHPKISKTKLQHRVSAAQEEVELHKNPQDKANLYWSWCSDPLYYHTISNTLYSIKKKQECAKFRISNMFLEII